MKTCHVCTRLIGAALIAVAGSSASEAGWLRVGGRCHYYPADSTGYAATSPLPSAVPSPATAAATSGPVVHQANRPVVGSEPSPGSSPAAANYSRRVRSPPGVRRIERDSAKLMGFRQFSTPSVMAVKGCFLEV